MISKNYLLLPIELIKLLFFVCEHMRAHIHLLLVRRELLQRSLHALVFRLEFFRVAPRLLNLLLPCVVLALQLGGARLHLQLLPPHFGLVCRKLLVLTFQCGLGMRQLFALLSCGGVC